jgi:hypothetical protein
MDCDVFDVLIDDLAREVPIDVTIRQRGLDHARSCSECSNRLEEARALTRGLRALAAADSSEHAPLNLEGVLLNAFEEAMKANPRAHRVTLFSRAGLAWAGMAAAVMITAIGVAVALYRERTPSPVAAVQRVPAPQQEPAAGGTAGEKPAVGVHSEGSSATQPSNRALPANSRPKSNRPARHVVWASDFIALPYADNAAPLGDADIVRLTMPNAALASLGLPVTEDNSARNITADILVGEDGIPRAISFVHL